MTTADDRSSDAGAEGADPIAALAKATRMEAMAAVAAALMEQCAGLPEAAWQKEFVQAADRAAIDYPAGFVPVSDEELAGEIGHLDGVAVTRLAQLSRPEPEDGVLTVLEHDTTSAIAVTMVSGQSGTPAEHRAQDGFDATVTALIASGWTVRAYETFETRVQDIVRAETARRRAATADANG